MAGFLSGFFGVGDNSDIYGAARKANETSTAAGNSAKQYNTNAQGYYQPYADTGGRANTLYGGALGLNGADGAQNAMAAYQQNPFLADMIAKSGADVDAGFRARGMSDSGAARLAAARAGEDIRYGDYNQWLNRLQGQQQMGLGAAGQQAGLESAKGDIDIGVAGQVNANNANAMNAVSARRQAGQNNLMGLIETAANIYTGGMYGVAKGAAKGASSWASGGGGASP